MSFCQSSTDSRSPIAQDTSAVSCVLLGLPILVLTLLLVLQERPVWGWS